MQVIHRKFPSTTVLKYGVQRCTKSGYVYVYMCARVCERVCVYPQILCEKMCMKISILCFLFNVLKHRGCSYYHEHIHHR